MTALDAGFWTAMRIRRKWLRDFCSIVFSIYYLIAAERADEKVRKVRGMLTLDHLRISWNKGTTPYLSFLSTLMRPRLMKYPPRAIRIPRPAESSYKEPVQAWLYFDGPLSAIKNHTKIVIDIPGGGFVAMDPRTNDDKLFAWAGKTGLPVLSLDYRKAPEYPYPYALNECYDLYRTVVATRGRCIGLSGEVIPKIVVTGDSAGGNLATALTLMILESSTSKSPSLEVRLPIPEGLILIYPTLNFNMVNWMSEEHMSLFRDRQMRKANRNMLRQKSMQYTRLAGTPYQSDDDDISTPPSLLHRKTAPGSLSVSTNPNSKDLPHPPLTLATTLGSTTSTRLAITSMISYFNDRVLDPSTMKLGILLYIGPHNRPAFSQDYLLSPVLAPSSLLAQFPKTYFLTGERDPLVDDTVIFAGRLRRAKAEAYEKEKERDGGLEKEFDDRDVVEVALIPGISHGFLQFVGVFPEGWKHIFRCAHWIDEIFLNSDARERHDGATPGTVASGAEAISGLRWSGSNGEGRIPGRPRHRRRSRTESSGDEALEMRTSRLGKLNAEHETLRAQKERLLKEALGEVSEERVAKARGRGRGRGRLARKQSSVSLASEDDILGRRMLGLVGGMTGMGEGNSLGDQ